MEGSVGVDGEESSLSSSAHAIEGVLESESLVVIDGEEFAGVGDIECLAGFAVDEAEVTFDVGCDFGIGEDLEAPDFESGAIEHVHRSAEVTEGEEVAGDDGDAASAVEAEHAFDGLFDGDVSAAFDLFEELEEGSDPHATGAWGQHPWMSGVGMDGVGADFFGVEESHDAECGGGAFGGEEFIVEEHGGGGIDEEDDVEFFFVLKLFDVGSLESGEDIPVDVSEVITCGVVAEVCEVGAAAAFSGEVFTAAAVGESAEGSQPHPLDLIQQCVVEE